MAAKTAVGSAAWIAAEQENVHQLLQEEREELIYPVTNELEWLNEHMADIFNQSQVDVANIFKTPGKLKGKTPRTIRKRPGETRLVRSPEGLKMPANKIQPLTDVFSTKPYQPSSPQKINKQASFAVSRDEESGTQPTKSQADSGYHGSSQIDEAQKTPEIPPRSPARVMKSPIIEMKEAEEENQAVEGSFHSAKENQTVKIDVPIPQPPKEETVVEADTAMEDVNLPAPEFDDIGSPSDESTPDRPLVRKKSSMTFASLPAREPLKTSIGARVSRTSHIPAQIRDSYTSKNIVNDDDYMEDAEADVSDDEENVEILGVDTSDAEDQAAKQHSKASTQRLHERINALGKAPAPRPSKSIPSAAAIAAAHKLDQPEPTYPIIPSNAEDDDDWIKPLPNAPIGENIAATLDDTDDEFDVRAPELIAHEERMSKLSPTPGRPLPGFGHAKSASTATLVSPAKSAMAPPPSPSKSISVSNMPMPLLSATPSDSPRRMLDGPLSTSKSKLASIMKTAKGLFTSSASVSAAAKMEAITPKNLEKAATMLPGMFPDLQKRLQDKPLPASPPKEGKRTRSSTEREKEEKRREKEAKVMQQMEDQLTRVREQEQQKAAQQKAMSPRKAEEERSGMTSAAKVSRPVRPARDVSKSKPQPVSIKVGTLSQRIPTASSVASSNPEVLPAEPKRPGLVKKASNASTQSSASTFKSSVSSQPAKPKALLAAERKREQDEKEAQRKLEQKREAERKRAAQQEEARRLEQEQRAEAERKERERLAAERAKRQAQQEAIERKRQEAARKADAQRAAREAAPTRPPSRLGQQVSRPLINHQLPTNPAKPAKRPMEEEQVRPQAPKFGAASQQADSKRRKTDEEFAEPPARPTMSGAPIRQSQLGKKPSIFNHPSYTQAPQPHLGQFPQPPNRVHPQMSQFANSKIPFAEPGPTGPTKTPLSGYHHRTIQAIKSSPQQPQYQNGESIQLPEILTDSEDEDSEDEGNAFPIPDWATPGHLTEQLMRQEGMDGDAVFGPIAPLRMEEIFAKGNKERLKRLRDRTSSANWVMSGDGLTLEEVRADREQREKMRMEGGWRYGT